MSYGKEIYQKALRMLEKRKLEGEALAQSNLSRFHQQCPEAEAISRQKAADSAKLVKIVLQGGDVRDAITSLRDKNLQLQDEYHRLQNMNGFSSDAFIPKYHCSNCKDTGFIDGRMCTCLSELQKKLAYERLNMHVPLENCSFASFDLSFYDEDSRVQMERIYLYCQKYADHFHAHAPSLLFRGATGLGKTHLALAIARTAIDKGFGVIYGSAQNIAVKLERERFDRTEDGDLSETNAKLLSCDLLILDDLGTEFTSSYVTSAIYNIINTRLLQIKPTVISTNLSQKELEKIYSERLASRIMGQYGIFNFIGKDIRIEKRRRKQS